MSFSNLSVKLSGETAMLTDFSLHLKNPPIDSRRSEIQGFSLGSQRRMSAFLREVEAKYVYMITLTYAAQPESPTVSKNQLRVFLQRLKRFAGRSSRQFSAFWFMEFQSRGAVHYHIFSTHCPRYTTVSQWWTECMQFGEYDDTLYYKHLAAGTRCERLRRGRDGCVRYALKYARKHDQKLLPEAWKTGAGRWWGAVGDKSRLAVKVSSKGGVGAVAAREAACAMLDQLGATLVASVDADTHLTDIYRFPTRDRARAFAAWLAAPGSSDKPTIQWLLAGSQPRAYITHPHDCPPLTSPALAALAAEFAEHPSLRAIMSVAYGTPHLLPQLLVFLRAAPSPAGSDCLEQQPPPPGVIEHKQNQHVAVPGSFAVRAAQPF
jgi:hypothetical protein